MLKANLGTEKPLWRKVYDHPLYKWYLIIGFFPFSLFVVGALILFREIFDRLDIALNATKEGHYEAGKLPIRGLENFSRKKRNLPRLSIDYLRSDYDEREDVAMVLIGADASLVVKGYHPDVYLFHAQGKLFLAGIVNEELAWEKPMGLTLSQWKNLFRGNINQIPGMKAWLRRV